MRGQAGIRISIESLNLPTGSPWEDCFSVDMPVEVLAQVIRALGGPAGVSAPQGPVVIADTPSTGTATETDDEKYVYGEVEDVFVRLDLTDVTREVLDAAAPSERDTITHAMKGMFRDLPHWDAPDGDLNPEGPTT